MIIIKRFPHRFKKSHGHIASWDPHRELLPHKLSIKVLEGHNPGHIRLRVHESGAKKTLWKTSVLTKPEKHHQVHQRRGAVHVLREADQPAGSDDTVNFAWTSLAASFLASSMKQTPTQHLRMNLTTHLQALCLQVSSLSSPHRDTLARRVNLDHANLPPTNINP